MGVGYVLMQKHSKCFGFAVNCCTTGWKCISIGSIFVSSEELKYTTIGGELITHFVLFINIVISISRFTVHLVSI